MTEIEEKARQEAKNYKTICSEDFTMSDMLSRPQDFSKQSIKDMYFRLKEKYYREGAKWGEWHDLRENPDDLPKYKNSMMIRICWINAYGDKCYHDAFYDDKGFYWVSEKTCRKIYNDEAIAWCELPQFKE